MAGNNGECSSRCPFIFLSRCTHWNRPPGDIIDQGAKQVFRLRIRYALQPFRSSVSDLRGFLDRSVNLSIFTITRRPGPLLQVFHRVHGPGQVVEFTEGSEWVNVRFVKKGQPYVTSVLCAELTLLG